MSVELPTLTFFKRGVNWVVFGSLKGGVNWGVIFSLFWVLFRVILGLMPDPLISFRIPSSERRDLEKFFRGNELVFS